MAQATTLKALLETIVSPSQPGEGADGDARIRMEGDDIAMAGGAVTSLALLLHEFANPMQRSMERSSPPPRTQSMSQCATTGERFVVTWSERRGAWRRRRAEGFGSSAARARLSKGQLGGDITRDWTPEGLIDPPLVTRDRLLHPGLDAHPSRIGPELCTSAPRPR